MSKRLISRHEQEIVRGLYGAGYSAARIAHWLHTRLVAEICTLDYARTYGEVRRVLRPTISTPRPISAQCPSDI